MAAAPQQPEMAELSASVLSGDPDSQESATSMQGEGGVLDGKTAAGPAILNSGYTADPLTTSTASSAPQMHTVAPGSDDEVGIVRGADKELAASTNGDNATITSRKSEEAMKAPMAVQVESCTLVQPSSVTKDVSSKPSASLGPPQDGQEKADQVTLELLLLSGSRKRFYFKSSATINEVLAWTFKDWPKEWDEQKPKELSQLRLLHRGQFLQGNSKLSAHQVEESAVTVMHLNIRPSEGTELIKPKRTKTPNNKAAAPTDTHGGGCCSSCIIS